MAARRCYFKTWESGGWKRISAEDGSAATEGRCYCGNSTKEGLGISRLVAGCFRDRRDPDLIEHSVEELVAQRVTGLALGYEDLNDHAELRRDALLAVVVGKADVLGEKRRCEKDRGFACASAATLGRLELGTQFSDRYRKIHADPEQMEDALLTAGVRCLAKSQQVFVLDFDATDNPLHGQQEGRFFHGYYDSYCYLPLYCFCGPVVLWAELRTADRDASRGTVEAFAIVRICVRRFHLALSSTFPLQAVFRTAAQRLQSCCDPPA